jgi:hypothetical protein
MPVLELEKIIHTKILGVTTQDRQAMLHKMHTNPEFVIDQYVKGTEVFVLFDNGNKAEKCCLGNIKDKYLYYLGNPKKEKKVKQWLITGGGELEGYGSRKQFLGINITIYY